MACSRPHSLLLLPSISRSGAGPRNLHFYKHPRESSNSGLRDIALDVKLSEGPGPVSVLFKAQSPGPSLGQGHNRCFINTWEGIKVLFSSKESLGNPRGSCPVPWELQVVKPRTVA